MSETQTQDDELVEGSVIAERLRIGGRGFRALVAAGLPHYRLNARVHRFRWSEVEQWLAERKKGGAL